MSERLYCGLIADKVAGAFVLINKRVKKQKKVYVVE